MSEWLSESCNSNIGNILHCRMTTCYGLLIVLVFLDFFPKHGGYKIHIFYTFNTHFHFYFII